MVNQATVVPLSESLDDAALVRQALSKHPAAFSILMKRYLKPVYSLIYSRVQNATTAEDLTQETFIKVYRALDQFNPDRPFKPWLLTIAINTAKTALKQASHQPVLFDDPVAGDAMLENDLNQAIQPYEPADTTLKGRLQNAMSGLSPNIQQAMMLRHVEELSYEDIAQALDANLNTVRTWLKRGRETLHAKLSADPEFINAL